MLRNILTIARREILSFFVSPVAYFVITGFVLLAAYFFFNYLVAFQLLIQEMAASPFQMAMQTPNLNEWVVNGYYQTLLIILVFSTPLLTMRTFAEEKKSGTFELLITSPLHISSIVLGKFLGVSFVLFVMLLFSFTFPALLLLYGQPAPEFRPMLSGMLGVALCSFGFASVGMAISSFSENQVVAGISSMVVLLLLFVINAPAEAAGGTVMEVLNYVSPVLQTREMIQGVVSLSALVYFASFIILGLFVSMRALELFRWR
jgi:ABC-2 type transport system permease protein